MFSSKIGFRVVVSIFALFSASIVVSAQAETAPYFAFVSAEGSDTNICTRAAPCREVSRALDVVRAGGTVMIIRSGEYAGFTISKNVSVIAENGVGATILGSAEAHVIEIGSPDAPHLRVWLRGLRVQATTRDSYDGVHVGNKIFRLEIENCEFINGHHNLNANADGRYFVKNSQFTKTENPLLFDVGIRFGTVNGRIGATVENCHFTGATLGLVARLNSVVTVRNSVAADNQIGFYVEGQGARLFIESSTANNNHDSGVAAYSSGAVRVSNSTITNHRFAGIVNSGGKAHTYGNNRIHNNGTATFGTVIHANQQ